jgi:hypothetical protein
LGSKDRIPNLRCGFIVAAKLAEFEPTFSHSMRKIDTGDRGWEVGTSPFIRFGIQLYHAFWTTISFRHGQLHHVGDDHALRCALYWPLYQAPIEESPS